MAHRYISAEGVLQIRDIPCVRGDHAAVAWLRQQLCRSKSSVHRRRMQRRAQRGGLGLAAEVDVDVEEVGEWSVKVRGGLRHPLVAKPDYGWIVIQCREVCVRITPGCTGSSMSPRA
ncbi:MAG: hypothetical protein CMJ94_12975 [Planctomycetes bacterium]|nr:hypothetical protein [Planctomycetota bacterium]